MIKAICGKPMTLYTWSLLVSDLHNSIKGSENTVGVDATDLRWCYLITTFVQQTAIETRVVVEFPEQKFTHPAEVVDVFDPVALMTIVIIVFIVVELGWCEALDGLLWIIDCNQQHQAHGQQSWKELIFLFDCIVYLAGRFCNPHKWSGLQNLESGPSSSTYFCIFSIWWNLYQIYLAS